ncbi:hypothetical protein [Enterococcus phage phiSHEF13]|uniref:Uncharacterized protein n=1 Tax=Enterococcus phage phiSHEF13 TaxID=2918648 RepID=A0AAE9FQN7_9CAUD|nr:hypothetical protein [Enterococcus phage phiSHEF13]
MKTTLERNRQEHINYILNVNKEVGIMQDDPFVLKYLNSVSLDELYELSELAEQLYKEYIQVNILEKAINEIEEIGVTAFKEKHGI